MIQRVDLDQTGVAPCVARCIDSAGSEMETERTGVLFLFEQAARCRRLARGITDTDMQRKLHDLAAEYEAEARLARSGDTTSGAPDMPAS